MAEGYHATGGLDVDAVDTRAGMLVGSVVEASLIDGLVVRTTLDPTEQLFLDDPGSTAPRCCPG